MNLRRLREILSREKMNGAVLVELEEDFYQSAREYVGSLGGDQKSEMERRNAERVLEEIVEMRFSKLARLVASGRPLSKLPPPEDVIAERLKEAFSLYHREKEKAWVVLKPIPAYRNWATGQLFGPLSPGESPDLPSEELEFWRKKGHIGRAKDFISKERK